MELKFVPIDAKALKFTKPKIVIEAPPDLTDKITKAVRDTMKSVQLEFKEI